MLNDTTHMQKFDDIQKLVLHVAEETDRVMVGTQHESKGLFKHDALSLMTATETRGWMKTEKVNGRSIHSRWLLPEAGLNDSLTPPPEGGKATPRFKERLPGNLPRLMALDEFGNKNLMDCVNRHVSSTKRLQQGPDVATDPKFELCDAVRASRAVLRCWNPEKGPLGGAPSSKTIIAGHKRVQGRQGKHRLRHPQHRRLQGFPLRRGPVRASCGSGPSMGTTKTGPSTSLATAGSLQMTGRATPSKQASSAASPTACMRRCR